MQGSWLWLHTYFAPSVKEKCLEGRNKTIYINLDVRYSILKEGQTVRRILLFYCYV